MPDAAGAKPAKVFEYQIAAGETPKSVATQVFTVDAAKGK
jgi:hypothetical protein